MKKIGLIILGIMIFASLGVSAQSNTVCCERTNSGAFCMDVPEDECADGVQQVPTACESTSYCKPGTCYDSTEGICMENTPQLVCNDKGGIWSEESPPQCDLGCCILGDQAAFVSLVRCKRLSAFLGLETNYDDSVSNELSCIARVQAQDRGACVYEFEFERTCKFTTRSECEGSTSSANGTIVDGEFFKDKLCSAEELGTICGPSTKTTCVEGKDEVYFVDTCGNPANIYDVSKKEDQEYWTNVKTKSESCNAGASNGNAENANCGNCNYLEGSYCRDKNIVGVNPTYGDFICADLNCENTVNGKNYRHGESWCVYDDEGDTGDGTNSVGSRFYKHICINGEEVLEQCADFRAEECIEDEIETSGEPFSQAACKVNRWQDCLVQTEQTDCENTDRRDCFWRPGEIIQGLPEENQPLSATTGSCLPKNPPGLRFWESEETKEICSQGNAICVIEYEKGLLDGGKKAVKNAHCEDVGWMEERANICSAIGDCGPGINWIGKKSNNKGFDFLLE